MSSTSVREGSDFIQNHMVVELPLKQEDVDKIKTAAREGIVWAAAFGAQVPPNYDVEVMVNRDTGEVRWKIYAVDCPVIPLRKGG